MAWVSPLKEDQLKDTSPELYEQLPKPVPGLYRILGQSAGSLQAFLSVTNGAMNQSHLTEELRETIAVTVSHQNECHFWLKAHGAALRQAAGNDEIVDKLKDYQSAGLDEKTEAVLDYAVKLTTDVANVEKADLQSLKDHGFTDRDLVEINQVVTYMNYSNRVTTGLGV